MNIVQAKELLLSLHQRFDPKRPLKEQLFHLFIPTLWGNSVIPTKSLHGRISHLLNKRTHREKQEREILQTFAKAMLAIQQDRSASSEIPLSFLVNLNRCLHQEKLLDSGIEIDHSSDPQYNRIEQEIKKSRDAQEKVKNESEINTKKFSLLRSEIASHLPNIDLKKFKALFDENLESKETIKLLHQYLKECPEHAHPRLNEYRELLEQGLKFQEELQSQFFPQSKPLREDVRELKLRKVAVEMETKIKSLPPGKPWIYCGSYGGQQSLRITLRDLFRKLPNDITESIPDIILRSLQSGQLPDPSQLITDGLHQGLQEAVKLMPEADKLLYNAFVSALLPNASRQMTGRIANALPKGIREGIESWMKQGLVGNLMEFVQDSQTRDFILWIAEKGKKIKGNPQEKEQILKSIEETAKSWIQLPIKEATQSLEKGLENSLHSLPQLIPDTFWQLLGFDNLFSAGQFWLEFMKQPNGKFTVQVYATGKALSFHPKNPMNQIKWPLVLSDVESDKLNIDFFHRLLFHHIEPQSTSESALRAEDLYTGLLDTLGGSPGPVKPHQWRTIPIHDTSERSLIQFLMTHPDLPPGQTLLELHFEALLAFCKPLLKGNDKTLKIESPEVCNALKHAINLITKEASALGTALEPSIKKQIDATLHEIQAAIDNYCDSTSNKPIEVPASPIKLPSAILNLIHNVLEVNGISADSLSASKSTLCWALGNEFGDLLDALTLSMKQTSRPAPAPQNVKAVKEAPQQGWLRTLIFSTYFKLVIKGLEIAMLFSKLYAMGIGMLIEPAVRFGLRKIIPTQIQEWYAEFIAQVKRTLTEFTLQIILRCFFSKEQTEILNQMLQTLRRSAKTLSDGLLEKEVLSFKLTAQLPLHKGHPLFQILFQNNLTRDFALTNFPSVNSNTLALMNDVSNEPFPTKMERLLKVADSEQSPTVLGFLLNEVQKMEIPIRSKEGFWDKVENPEQCLEHISDLQLYIFSNLNFVTKQRYGDVIAASFALLAIIDKLARRCPNSHLEGLDIDAFHLFHWLNNKEHAQVDNPAAYEQLEKASQYLMPGINLDDLPSNKELAARSKKTLFDYSYLFLSQTNFMLNKETLESPEIRYLEARFKEPETQKKLKAKNIDPIKLHSTQKIHLLIWESSILAKDDFSILPRSYNLLRLHTLLCKQLCHAKYIWGPVNPFERSVFGYKTVNYPLQKYEQRTALEMIRQGEFLNAVAETATRNFPFQAFPRLTLEHAFEGVSAKDPVAPKTQSQIMASSKSLGLPELNALQKLIDCEPSNQILRALAHFKQYPDQLSYDNASDIYRGHNIAFLEQILFHPGKLSRLLRETPKIAEAIGESLTRITDYLMEHDFRTYSTIVRIALKLQKFCQHYSPQQMHAFPNFRLQLLKALEKNPSFASDCYLLVGLSYGKPNDKLADIETREAIVAITKAFFYQNVHGRNTFYKDSRGVDIHDDSLDRLLVQYGSFYSEWLPVIKKQLQNQEFKEQIAKILLSEFKIPITDKKIEINFTKGIIKGEGLPQFNFTQQIKDRIASICHINQPIKADGKGRFIAQDGSFELCLGPPNTSTYICRKRIDRKQFRLILPSNLYSAPLLNSLLESSWQNNPRSREFTLWLEETTQSQKELLIYRKAELHKRVVVKNEMNSESYRLVGFFENDQQLQCVDARSISNQITPITRFCPPSEIQCGTTQEQIQSIEIPSYNLSFDVQELEGELRAFCKQKPGFFITTPADLPFADSLNKFSNFLLLTNRNGEKKVLIPNTHFISSAAWKYTSLLGPFAQWANRLIDELTKPIHKKENKVYLYEIDSSTGQLTSDDSEALAFLISLYIVQGEMGKAMYACTEFELLCKRQSMPSNLFSTFLPIFIPCDQKDMFGLHKYTHEVRSIRHRLLAALEENRLIHSPEKKENSNTPRRSKPFPADSLVTALILLIDLKEFPKQDPRLQISDHQEWYLFKKLFSCLQEMIDYGANFATPLIKKVGVENLFQVLLPPIIAERYTDLKKRLEIKDHLLLKTTQIVRKVFNAPSSIPYTSVAPSIGSYESMTLEACHSLFSHIMDNRALDTTKRRILSENISCHINTKPTFMFKEITPNLFVKDFLGYYAIARGEGTKEQKDQLRKLLPLIKGGWDIETRMLLRYLEAVSAFPLIFIKTKSIQDALKHKNYNPIMSSKWLDHLNETFILSQASASVGKLYGMGVIELLVNKSINSKNPIRSLVHNMVPMASLTLPLAQLGSKAYNAFSHSTKKANAALQIVPKTQEKNSSVNYTGLESIDHHLDQIFKDLFEIAFEEISPENLKSRAEASIPFQSASKEHAEKVAVDRVNASLKDFYARPANETRFLRIKGKEKLWELYVHLIGARDLLKANIDNRRNKLLTLIHSNQPKTTKSKPLTFDELQTWFLKEQHSIFADTSGLPVHVLDSLDFSIARDSVLFTRLQQMERAIRHFEELSQLDPNTHHNEFDGKIEQLADELRARRAYRFSIPSRLLKRYLKFELSTDKMLWRKQAEFLQTLLLGNHDHAVIELLMSFGKTYFGIPTIDSFEADGKKLVFNIWPAGMYGTNTRQISKQSKQVYDQTSNALRFNRSTPLKTENTEAILMLLKKVKQNHESINMTKEDAQAAELLFIDRLYTLAHPRGKRKNEEDTLLHLAGILRTMRWEGKAIGDEAHELFNYKQELNYPIGSKEVIPLQYYQVIEACLRHAAAHPKLRLLIQNNDSQGIQDILQQELIPYLAEKMSHYWKFKIDDSKRKEFIAFVTGQSKVIPAWIQTSPHYSEISLVKGLLKPLLPMVWKRSVNVDYGPSLKNNGEYARPYEGNTSPMEQSTILEPFESIVKTGVMFIHRKLSLSQTTKALFVLIQKMKKEMKIRGVSESETAAYKLFEKCAPAGITLSNCPNISQESLSNEEKVKAMEIIKAISQQDEMIFFYMRHFVRNQIQFWPLSIRSDAQNFSSMFHSQFHDTGTPYNDGSYADHITMLWDPGTTGEALHILNKKCPKDGIHILKKSRPTEVLDELLTTYFRNGSDFTALIDGGALLHGLDNVSVAKQMLEYVKKQRPDIHAVDFFMQDEEGREQLMTWEVNAAKPIPYDQCNLPPKSRLAYFDQRHGFAANIPQKFNGKGLNLIGATHTLYRLLQEVFRMRGIKMFKRLVTGEMNRKELEELNQTQTQSIHFAMTSEVQKLISPNGIPTLRDLIEFAIRNESKLVSEQNYHSYRKKVNDVIRRAMLDKILKAQTPKQMVSLFTKCEHVFVSRCETDPKKLYGLLDGYIPTEHALEACRKNALDSLKKSGIFLKQEQAAIENALNTLKKPPMPNEVHIYKDNTRIHTELLDNLGREISQEQECDQEQEMDCDLHTVQQKKKMTSFKEWGWSSHHFSLTLHGKKDQNKVSFLQKTMNQFTHLIGYRNTEQEEQTPPLFRVTDLLKNSTNKSLQKISTKFDPRIWMSNNFLPQEVRRVLESPAEIGSCEQRELFEVLVHLEESPKGTTIQSIGCLSLRDASKWRKRLAAREANSKEDQTRVILYDTALRAVTAGSDVNAAQLRKNKDFLKLEAQLRFINATTQYPGDQMSELANWIGKADAEQMQEAFNTIHAQRGKETIAGSDIDHLFAELQQIPLEETL